VRTGLIAAFADELSAYRYLEGLLWGDGVTCPYCGADGRRVGKLDGSSTRIGARKCYACRKKFSIVRGTLFERSHVPLHKWLQAIYLTDGGSAEIRPYHLSKIVNVSCKTAVQMLRKLKDAANGSEKTPPGVPAAAFMEKISRQPVRPSPRPGARAASPGRDAQVSSRKRESGSYRDRQPRGR
jgi:transposase-like protein